jgi:hypothetical protein
LIFNDTGSEGNARPAAHDLAARVSPSSDQQNEADIAFCFAVDEKRSKVYELECRLASGIEGRPREPIFHTLRLVQTGIKTWPRQLLFTDYYF